MHCKFPYAISLGSSCVSRRFIDIFKLSKEFLFFDWIGSPMWAVNKLVENKFHGLDNANDFKPLMIRPSDRKFIMTHEKYYLRFLHDFPLHIHNRGLLQNLESEVRLMDEVISKYKRRGERFLQIVGSSRQILFIRLQEDQSDRIKYENYSQQPTNELEQLKRFSAIVKAMNPLLEFQVLFFTTEFETSRHVEECIFVLKYSRKIDWFNCEKEFPALLRENKSFLEPLFSIQD